MSGLILFAFSGRYFSPRNPATRFSAVIPPDDGGITQRLCPSRKKKAIRRKTAEHCHENPDRPCLLNLYSSSFLRRQAHGINRVRPSAACCPQSQTINGNQVNREGVTSESANHFKVNSYEHGKKASRAAVFKLVRRGGVNWKINIAHVWNGSASSRESMDIAARKLPDSKQQQQRKTSYVGFKLSANIAVRKSWFLFFFFLGRFFTWPTTLVLYYTVRRASIKHHFGWPPIPIRRKSS